MQRKRRSATVTIRMNRDGTYNFRSTGGYDLRKLFPTGSPPAKSSSCDVNVEPAHEKGNSQSCHANPIADAHPIISGNESLGGNVTDEWLATPIASTEERSGNT